MVLPLSVSAATRPLSSMLLPFATPLLAMVDPAVGWLGAFGVIIALSLTARINVGLLAIVFAWVVGVSLGGLKLGAVTAAFPASLFVTLLGVTLLFGAAEVNGTLAAGTQRFVRSLGGVAALLPPAFFLLAATLSAAGPGAVSATALVAPLAMTAGAAARVPPVLMALLVANGANAGSLSPFSAVGVIVQTQFAKAGLTVAGWQVFLPNFIAHLMMAVLAYVLFGGLKLSRQRPPASPAVAARLTPAQGWTLAVLGAWIAAVVFLRVDVGLAAFAAVSVLILAHAAEDSAVTRAVPWSVLVMVCGVSLLVEIGQMLGGLQLFTRFLAAIATPGSVNGVMAFVTGVVSTYSSTSGVVYPAFLPMVPGLVAQLGGGHPLEIGLSINVGAALVDVSPLSTLGALCIAAAVPHGADGKAMFRALLIWGFAMTTVGALFCQFFIHWFIPAA